MSGRFNSTLLMINIINSLPIPTPLIGMTHHALLMKYPHYNHNLGSPTYIGKIITFVGRQIKHRKDIDLYLKPFRGNNNIINFYTSYEKNVQLYSNKYLLLLLLLFINIKYCPC